MRRLALVVLAACSGSSPETPAHVPHRPPATRPTIVHAGHAAAIEIVAATDDGKAAVTQDALGGTRLWPTLDGTVEPVVVRASGARELALGREDGGFVIAVLDPAGTLELVRIGADGAVRGRHQIHGETAIEQIAMTPAGVLALRADQTLGVLAPDGRERARLAPPTGARIVSVIARDGHAVALIAEPELHAPTIELEPVRWGARGGTITIPASRPVLSPDGRHLAMHLDNAGVAIIEVASGKEARAVCVAPEESSELDRSGLSQQVRRDTLNGTAPAGFVDARTIACFSLGRLVWWGLDGKQLAGERQVRTPEEIAVGNGVTIAVDHDSLALATKGEMRYLGYRISNPTMVRTGPLGVTVRGGAQPILLDRALHARARLELPSDSRQLEDLMPLDDRHALVSYENSSTEMILHHLAMIDTTTHKATALPYATTAYELRYEPATQLLALAERNGLSVAKLDPVTMTFSPRVHLGAPAHDVASSEPAVYLTDPALANGVAVIVVRKGHDGRAVVDEYDADEVQGSLVHASHTYEVYGEAVAVDRAGRVYLADGDQVNVFTAGQLGEALRVTTLPGHVIARPSPDATRVLLLGDNRLQMVDLAGHVQWMVPAPTAVDAGWIDDEPFARFAAGLAKLDPDTGALLERACSWRFELATEPFESTSDSQSVCDED